MQAAATRFGDALGLLETVPGVTLSRAALASGQERLAIAQGALARSSVQVMGYGLLCVMYPEEAFDLGERIGGALTAYACDDALGLPWERAPDGKPDTAPSQAEQLPARRGWPRGATSDDTALTLLVARHLADRDGDGGPGAFSCPLTPSGECAAKFSGPKLSRLIAGGVRAVCGTAPPASSGTGS